MSLISKILQWKKGSDYHSYLLLLLKTRGISVGIKKNSDTDNKSFYRDQKERSWYLQRNKQEKFYLEGDQCKEKRDSSSKHNRCFDAKMNSRRILELIRMIAAIFGFIGLLVTFFTMVIIPNYYPDIQNVFRSICQMFIDCSHKALL